MDNIRYRQSIAIIRYAILHFFYIITFVRTCIIIIYMIHRRAMRTHSGNTRPYALLHALLLPVAPFYGSTFVSVSYAGFDLDVQPRLPPAVSICLFLSLYALTLPAGLRPPANVRLRDSVPQIAAISVIYRAFALLVVTFATRICEDFSRARDPAALDTHPGIRVILARN